MAQIPMGGFERPNVRVQVAGNGSVPRVSNPIPDAVAGLGEALQHGAAVLNHELQQRHDEGVMLARARAQNAVLDDEIRNRAILEDVQARIFDGSLDYEKAPEELESIFARQEPLEVEGLDPIGRESYQRSLQRNRFQTAKAVENLVNAARRRDLSAQVEGTFDRLGKLASDPNADIEKLVAGGMELLPLAQRAGMGEQFGKKHQDFADRVYRDNASARLVAGRDDMAALDALENDLTQEGGRYHGKLDASARNTLLAQVQSRRAQLEAKAETAARKGEAAAARVLEAQEKQVASTIPAPIEVLQERSQTIEQFGTDEQKAQWQQLLQDEVQVRELLAQPPAAQVAFLEAERARQRTGGATLAQQANLKRMEAAVERNIKDLREQPLVAYQRLTGDVVPPLDVQALATGDAGRVQGQLAARADTLRALREKYGPEVGSAPLLPQEASMLAAALDKAPPGATAQLFGVLANVFGDPGTYRAAIQQIAPDSPVRAYAGMVFAEQRETTLKTGGLFSGAVKASSGDVARTILEGEALLNPSRSDKKQDGKGAAFPMPPPADIRAELDTFVGRAFAGRPGAYEVAEQAVRAYYAGASAKVGDVSGELDRKRMQEAVRAVIGEPVDINGADVLPPWGMEEDDFVQALEDRWPALLPMLPEGVSRDLDDYQLQQAGGSRYYVIGATGLYLTDRSGNPVQIDVRAPVPSGPASERRDRTQSITEVSTGSNWRGGARGL